MRTNQSRMSRPLDRLGSDGYRQTLKRYIAGGVTAAILLAGPFSPQNQGWAQTTKSVAAERSALLIKGRDLIIPAEKRPSAPPIRLKTASYADGSIFDLSEERGNVVILYFMAAWCASCLPEAQALGELHKAYAAKGLRILVLDVDQRETEVHLARFRERAGNGEYLWALDGGNQVARPYRVRALDTTIFIDREGRIAYGDAFPTPYQDLAAVTEALLE